MRFRCLVMDHDDTTVNSTATIHFPSFLAYLKLVRPEASYTLEDYFRKNFDPGIMALFTGELGFSEEELEGEFRFWQDWVRTRVRTQSCQKRNSPSSSSSEKPSSPVNSAMMPGSKFLRK